VKKEKVSVFKTVKIDRRTFKKIFGFAIKVKKYLKLKGELNIIFVGDKRIKKLNLEFLKRNSLTDVIAFDLSDEKNFLYEIYICFPVAKRQAKKWDAFKECCFLITHGILHLKGMDDRTPEMREKMIEKQKKILEKLL